jgi:hypothetical protein
MTTMQKIAEIEHEVRLQFFFFFCEFFFLLSIYISNLIVLFVFFTRSESIRKREIALVRSIQKPLLCKRVWAMVQWLGLQAVILSFREKFSGSWYVAAQRLGVKRFKAEHEPRAERKAWWTHR